MVSDELLLKFLIMSLEWWTVTERDEGDYKYVNKVWRDYVRLHNS